MSSRVIASPLPVASERSATRVAVVAALSATAMLFASLTSAYLVRRSFADWRPSAAAWPFFLLAFGAAASFGIEAAVRSESRNRRRGLWALGVSSAFYLAGAVAALLLIASKEGGVASPHDAFVVLLLGVHTFHALLGAAFAAWILRDPRHPAGESGLSLVRLVTHFLTALLFAIVFLLFVLQ